MLAVQACRTLEFGDWRYHVGVYSSPLRTQRINVFLNPRMPRRGRIDCFGYGVVSVGLDVFWRFRRALYAIVKCRYGNSRLIYCHLAIGREDRDSRGKTRCRQTECRRPSRICRRPARCRGAEDGDPAGRLPMATSCGAMRTQMPATSRLTAETFCYYYAGYRPGRFRRDALTSKHIPARAIPDGS